MVECKNINDKQQCIDNPKCHYIGIRPKRGSSLKKKPICYKKSLYTTFMYGGMGYGSICLPDSITDLVIMIIFPPLYVFFYQKTKKFENILQIINSFILTSCFYFPGLLHALYLKYSKIEYCGSILKK